MLSFIRDRDGDALSVPEENILYITQRGNKLVLHFTGGESVEVRGYLPTEFTEWCCAHLSATVHFTTAGGDPVTLARKHIVAVEPYEEGAVIHVATGNFYRVQAEYYGAVRTVWPSLTDRPQRVLK